MTAILTISPSKTLVRSARLLLVGASCLALGAPLAANQLLFTTSDARLETGQRTEQRSGLTQIALTGGGVVSIVDAANYRLNADGSIDLYEGAITVAAGSSGEVVVRMPEGLEGRVGGAGSAGNFVVRANGEASGHALTGAVRVGRPDKLENFKAGEMWRSRGEGGVKRVIANAPQVQPVEGGGGDRNDPLLSRQRQAASVVPIGGDAGPVAAAINGIPVGLGDQLAAAGASGDIIAAARRIEAVVGNPSLDTFPSGDFSLLVAAAAQLEGAYGGTPFPAAQADIIRAYLRFLAGGGSGNSFLATYSGFVVNYLDLIRSGGLPSGFASASPGDVEAFLAYIRRTGEFTNLAARDRVLAEAYLNFLASGGNRDAFARSFTDLTIAYFTFVRGGGDPAAFTGASQAVLAQTIAFLRDSGLVVQLSAADRALVEAFLANGGLAFAAQYRAALGDYFAFLASGRLPSSYTALDQATLRAYLETLSNTGLLTTVLGDQAAFYADYLAFLRAGGQIDAFAGLPANIFAGYAAQLDAYFAFLATGRLPSEYSGSDIATLQAYLLELQAAGALERFLGDRAAFFAQFAAFVAAGGNFDSFAGLPANIFAGYAVDLRAFFEFLEAGGVPSAYTLLTPEQIRAYIAALEAAGATSSFLGDLASFYRAYAVYLAGGGNPDLFDGLPVPPDFPAFAAALNAYAAFLQAGGLPSAYTAEDLSRLRSFIEALNRSGQLASLLGDNADLLTRYFAYLAGGGSPDGFVGLPVYAQYIAALNAYYAFLQGGGLPSGYAELDAATIAAYLAALAALEGGLAGIEGLDPFFVDYFIFIAGGGDPDQFAGLPINGGGGGNPPEPNIPPVLNGYSGGFNPESANISIILGGSTSSGTFVGGEFGFGASPYTLDANGGLSSYTRQPGGQVRNRGAAQQTDIFGNADAVIGRWTNGTISIPNTFTFNENQGLHYVLTRPAEANILNTLTGRVDYYLIAATRPTIANGSLAPGRFDAGMAIALGSEYRLAMEGTITMPAGSNPYIFSFATEGGLADPSLSQTIIGANSDSSFFVAIPGRDNAGNCTANPTLCVFNMRGAFAGDLDTIGISYEAAVPNRANHIIGTAIFAAGPNRSTGGNGGGGSSSARLTRYLGGFPANSGRAYATDVGYNQPGNLAAAVGSDGALQSAGDLRAGTASAVEVAGDERAVLGRFAGGTATFRNNTSNYAANQGLPYVVMAPMVGSLPASGQIDYRVYAATNPIFSSGETAPGTFDGSLSIRFGSQLQYRTSGSIVMPESGGNVTYTFASTGFDQGTFQNIINAGPGPNDLLLPANVTGTGRGCAGSGCTISFYGGFGGQNPQERLGLVYQIFPGNFALPRILGAVIYAPEGTTVPSLATTTSTTGMAMARAAMPASAAVLPVDWSRWAGGLSAGGRLPANSETLSGIGKVSPGLVGIAGNPASTDRAAMIRQAEQLMGGLITFGEAARELR
ncbi:hypothetical protein [Erythrobacter tepidarius]|uniref:hypothetical protein n=1 Tax=Erythrobacter tepidarius TaxID=60454 RepID=UPI000A3CBEBE|nr:hypothetical protein [Erythrobacter tepidarius]